MSTITREFTKEQLQQIIETDHVQCGEASSLARIALASLEAEAVCVIDQSNLDYLKSGSDADVWPASRAEMGDVLLYRSAPPAPANAEPVAWLWSHRKHPSEVSLVRPEDDERAEGVHWSGWSCQALYAAPPAPISVPAAMEMDDDFDSSFEHGKAVGWNACRAAMLQGADGNSPVIANGWVACSERMPDQFKAILAFNEYGEVWSGAYDRHWNFYCDNLLVEHVTHWMPLPAAPQQEA
ncbi:Protein of uncharacterised function (DUF551) [Enterobacter hormaechei]|uniref:DUF551 domain-containing protein n=1 Tax=Enterobacter hormaechei TaxID=158836 RepID=UPI0007953292|nr:DUF551 domain-containing protein [Enterobacter hormaechei]SAD93560.1 Protein of uncharacterised function (DUF551) [Enterobacter hormaechei]SAE03795.1 Protein of uncharacterised function (DUF551) [Enterobacter hormaechei]SAE61218.1 Protein of uncharacterised function (DUF551) [Enterobacter hormaechei]